MAYSNLVSLERTIDQILNYNQFSISHHLQKHIISLDKYVIFIQAFLEDFPEKATNLEARIRDAAMEAEDVIEWYMTEQIRYKFRYTHWIAELRRIKFEFQLRKVREQMDSVAGEVVEIINRIIIKDAKLDAPTTVGASSSSHVADAGKVNMVGLDEDLLEIKTRLCGDSPQLQILPITGMGGIGKTTLARNIYDDPFIMEHFQIRVWLTISQDYSEERLLSDLLGAMKEFDPEKMKESVEENPQQGNESGREESNANKAEKSQEENARKALKVYQILVGRRFLIVMDDMWSTKVLDDVRKLFPDNNNGSQILLTTRLADVAAYANSSMPSHEIRLMNANQSWNLLRQKVFAHQDRIPNELENIGREIARCCGGLPLAVVVVAGVLSTVRKAPTSWEEIARNVKSCFATTDGQIEKILSLSYNHLPHHLRACFLYMGGFPEDHEIKVIDLKTLWIAEGFVKPFASKSFEDRAEEYLQDLIRRSLVVASKHKSNGRIKSCRLHDLLRDLCIKLSQEEKFLVHVKGREAWELMEDQRRISRFSHSYLYSFPNIFSSTIRTIIYLQYAYKSFGSFRLLRVLDVLSVRFKSHWLTDQFFDLFHLRYLAFWYRGEIPRAISNLQSLQTLIIKGAYYTNLPHEFWNMPQLRHLSILDHFDLAHPIGATLALENLQTLGRARNLMCSLTLFQLIPNLKKLSLIYSSGTGELLFHNFVLLSRLEELKLEGELWWTSSGVRILVLPSSLKKLALIGWGGMRPYLKIVGPLPNLEVLKLRNFDFMEQEWTTSDEDFPNLRFLLMDNSNLKQWNSEGSHFPLLEHLLLHSCESLSEIPDSMGEIPTLKLIEAKYCRESLMDYITLMQEEQRDYGDDVFRVHCVKRSAAMYKWLLNALEDIRTV